MYLLLRRRHLSNNIHLSRPIERKIAACKSENNNTCRPHIRPVTYLSHHLFSVASEEDLWCHII